MKTFRNLAAQAALGLAGNTAEEASGVMAAPVANFAEGFRGVGVAAGMNRADVCPRAIWYRQAFWH